VLDVFEESQLPCVVTGFSYFHKLQIVIVAPIAVVVALVLGCIVMSACTTTKRRRRNIGDMVRERRRGVTETHVIKRGLWMAATPALFLLDLLYPSITRTLFQFFTCRTLGPDAWLEADYGVNCNGAEYNAYYSWVGVSAFTYAIGVPAFFVYLVRRFKYRGKQGDKVIQSAIGWMCTFSFLALLIN